MGLAEVSNILWRQRHLLDLLEFKMEEQQLLLAAGRTRWVARATNEVERVLEELRTTELVRSVAVEEAARDLGLHPGPSLRELIAAAPEPWADILAQHRDAFLTLTGAVTVLAQQNQELLGRVEQATRDVLGNMGEPVATVYTPDGLVSTRVSSLVVDEVL